MKPSVAYAHGLAVYVSTPVTPPKGWLWLPVLFMIASIVWDWFVLRGRVRWYNLIWREVLGLVVFFALFYAIGVFTAIMTTAPLPGLGPPHRAMYGLSLLGGGTVFLFFNAIGLLLFIRMKKLICWTLKLDLRERRALLHASKMSYILALLPYVVANAMAHGWAGGYVNRGCGRQLGMLGDALIGYAQANGDKLPEAKTFSEMFVAVMPYLDPAKMEEGIEICPIEDVFNRKPRTYIWNARFSGAALSAYAGQPLDEPILRCPAVHDVGDTPALYPQDLLRISEKGNQPLDYFRLLYRESCSEISPEKSANNPPIEQGKAEKNP